MDAKRILVLDDDPDLLFLVAHGVKSLSPDYQVGTANSAVAALELVQKQNFDLVVTDFMMPQMTGLELVPKVREISPGTQFVLMTAHHDTKRVQGNIKELGLAGFVGKPFVLADLLEIVQRVVKETSVTVEQAKIDVASLKKTIDKLLRDLWQQTEARSIVLVNTNGTPIHRVGSDEPAVISRLSTFVSANFLAVAELSSLFGDNESIFKSSFYEGNNYNIYAYNINGDYFLAVLFGCDTKPGTVWFYTKQAAAELDSLLPTVAVNHKSDNTIANDFDTLLGDKVIDSG